MVASETPAEEVAVAATEEAPAAEVPVVETAPVVEGSYVLQELAFRSILYGIGVFALGKQQQSSRWL